MKVCIVIPVYNEAKALATVLNGVKPYGHDVVVINDGSNDGSGDIARSNGAYVISNANKSGKGYSLRQGFEYAIQHGYDAVLAMDGDGQHAPSDIPQFIDHYRVYQTPVIIGNRMANHAGMPLVRRWTNQVMSLIISALCRHRVADTQCGYRLIAVDVLRQVQLICSDYEIESELLIKAGKRGFAIASVPVKTIYEDEKSHIHPVHDTVRFVKYMFREMTAGS